MTPYLRKVALTAHIVLSVGWLGAIIPYLALAIAGLRSHDAQMIRAAYLSMELIGWFVIVPLSLAAFVSGIVQSLGTPWGVVPALVDQREAPADDGRHGHPADAHAGREPHGSHCGRYYVGRN